MNKLVFAVFLLAVAFTLAFINLKVRIDGTRQLIDVIQQQQGAILGILETEVTTTGQLSDAVRLIYTDGVYRYQTPAVDNDDAAEGSPNIGFYKVLKENVKAV